MDTEHESLGVEKLEVIGAEKRDEKNENESPAIDYTSASINIDKEGWVHCKIHLSRGLYSIIGFLREVEDHVRFQYARIADKRKVEEKKIDLLKPKGFRGFNPFKKA